LIAGAFFLIKKLNKMKKFYPIVRRKFHWKLLLITILIFVCPTICKATFTSYGTNSITNGSAETGNLSGWTSSGYGFNSSATGSDPTPKEGGTYVFDYFPNAKAHATLTQIISLSAISSDISAGKVKAVLTGSINKLEAGAIGYILLEELSSGGSVLNSQQENCSNFGAWDDKTITIPILNTATSQIRITLYGETIGLSDYCDFDVINLALYRWPVVTTTAASSITTTTAILGGNVTLDGGPSAARGIVYSTTNTNPTIGGSNVTQVPLSSGSGIFTTTLSGLSGAQKYYYNAYATNTLGTVYGTVNNFTTLTPTYLTATTNEATNVTINSVTLNGSVNANGRTTDVYFQYGTTTSYGTQVAASPSTATGTSASTETLSLTGLASSTTYHYRMAAYNATELWKYGEDKTFTTATPVPKIGLKQSSTAIADGGSYDFGSKLLSSNTDIVFTIQNSGTSALTLTTPITIGGTNADQFSIQAQPTSPVAAAGSTTFTIRFSPTSTGSKSASISIGNNDSNENPYDLTITGQGYAAPTVTTGVQTINTQGVNVSSVLTPMTITTLKGSVNANNASTAVTFEYGTTTAYGTSVTATGSPVAGTSVTSVTCTPTLLPNTTYHYRVVGTNAGGTTNGADQTFTTPVIEHFTDETTDYAQTFTEGGTTFTMTGYLFDKYDPLGGYEGPDCFYDAQMISNLYNVMPSAGIVGSIKNATNNFYVNNFWIAPGNASYTFGQYGNVIIRGKRSGTTLFTYTLTSANTNNTSANNFYTYIDLSSYNSILIDELEFEVTNDIRHLKIDAFNFNYPAPFVPTVTTQAVTNIGVTTATGNGNITNLGNPNPTAYGICYGIAANPDITGSKVDKGTGSVTGAFVASITGLTPNITYHTRAYVTNNAGTVYGSEQTFTTLLPTITSATYDESTGILALTCTNISSGDVINPAKITIKGEGGETYTLTTTNVTAGSSTAVSITLNATDKAAINLILNKNGTSSTSGTIYNVAMADDWDANITAGDIPDLTGNGITVSNVAVPTITSATYDASTGTLAVTGTGFLKLGGTDNDINVSKLSIIGEGSASYTLTTSNVDLISGTAFSVVLNATDKAAINTIVNKNGTSSKGGTTYNLAAAEDWDAGAYASVTIADNTGNGIMASNVGVPTVTSISPTGGPLAGNISVTITGTNLAEATEVKFGTSTASITSKASTQVVVTAPSASSIGTVDVTVTTAGGTSATSDNDKFTYSPATGIDDAKLDGVTIYPNPVDDRLYIKGVDDGEIAVYDMGGCKVISARLESNKAVDVSGLTKGVYTVRITTPNGTAEKKLVKK
jgi:hypothetical protein